MKSTPINSQTTRHIPALGEDFGPTILDDAGAKAFLRQIRYGRATRAMKETLRRGDELLRRFPPREDYNDGR